MSRPIDMMALIRARAPSVLVAAEAFSRLEALAPLLPDVMSSYYLECRLAANSGQVDLMGCVRASDGGRERLTSHLLRCKQYQEHPIWKSVTDFCTSWSEPGSPLYDLVPHVWLAFDLDGSSSSTRGPCLLLCTDPDYLDGTAQPKRSDTTTALQFRLLTDAVFNTLLKRYPDNSQRLILWSCHDLLPPGGRLIHLSMMLTRSSQTCKLNISMPKAEIVQYLRCIHWSGSIIEIGALLSRFCADNQWIKLQLVICESLAPTIELELHFDESQESQERYRALLDRMCESGLCSTEKREALRRWSGRFRLISPGQEWPTQWTTWTDVKIVHWRDHALFAKAYLGFMPSFSIF
jgi:hypothetical protein